MNKVVLLGRLTRDPELRYTQGENPTPVARYTMAVNRLFKREGEPEADFINCIVFGTQAKNAEAYLRQGSRVSISGRIITGSYVNKNGARVYTTEVVVEEQEFAETKAESERNRPNTKKPSGQQSSQPAYSDGFMNIPEGIDEELPFS